MNIDYFKNLNLKCTYCNSNALFKDYYYYSMFQWLCNNNECLRFEENSIFLRVILSEDNISCKEIEFFLHEERKSHYGFQYSDKDNLDSYDDRMIYIAEQKMLKLLEEYSKTNDIEPIRQKYYDLILFK